MLGEPTNHGRMLNVQVNVLANVQARDTSGEAAAKCHGGTKRSRLGLCSLVIAWAACSCAGVAAHADPPVVNVSHPGSVGQHNVLEVVLDHVGSYANVWEDVVIEATFVGPGGIELTVGGFYYDVNEWRIRVAPSPVGAWTWSGTFTTPEGQTAIGGAFDCTSSDNRGHVRQSPINPFRFEFDDGTAYYPIGFGDCIGDADGSGSPHDNDWGLDGEFRKKGQKEGWTVDIDTYLAAYGPAGFNFFRWSVDNCAFALWDRISPAGNIYLVREGKWGDELVTKFRAAGFRIMLVFFGFSPAFPGETSDNANMAAVKRYVKYCMDRYGAYVDFYELMNEASVTDQWYEIVAEYVRQEDPYAYLISTSWERPDLSFIEVYTPHWYEREDELVSDYRAATTVISAKAHGKPVVFGEQGNSVQNWDPRSGVRMRLRNWAAFFTEGSLIFWNSSWAKDYYTEFAANLYIGPEERGYIRVLRDLADRFDGQAVMTWVPDVDHNNARQYVLASSDQILAYVVHSSDHETPLGGRSIIIDVPGNNMTGVWIDPSSGSILETFAADQGSQALPIPAFTVDIALVMCNPITGDFDCDGDVDLPDLGLFVPCLTGPDVGPAAPGCSPGDFDLDNDVDLEDFAAFQVVLAGPSQ